LESVVFMTTRLGSDQSIVQALPDAAGTFGDVGLGTAALVNLEIVVGTVGEELSSGRVRSPVSPATNCSGSDVVGVVEVDR